MPVDEDEARGERSGRHLLQPVLAVGGTPGPGARQVPARATDAGGGRRRAAAAAARPGRRRRGISDQQATLASPALGDALSVGCGACSSTCPRGSLYPTQEHMLKSS